VRKHNKPRPRVAHRGIAHFLGKMLSVRPMVTPHLPWKFHANRSSRLLVMLTNDIKEISIAASHGFSELTQNWIRSSHGYSAPSLKIHANRSNRFLVILLTKNQRKTERYIHTYIRTNKEIDRKQYSVPRCIGDGVTKLKAETSLVCIATLIY